MRQSDVPSALTAYLINMATTHKKVVVRKMDRDMVSGYVSAAFISDGKIEVLNTAGNVVAIDLREVKGVYFVREFGDTESLARKTFTSRPRTEGLWVRLRFRDNEIIEGMMINDLVQDGTEGFSIIPPDTRSNTQRIFVPRSALAEMTVLAVIGEKKSQRRGRHPDDTLQVPMFN
ncbi:MAG TPA: hypothetical protein VFC15_10735 [Candidatus Limnocylindrales bacterium]|nr:hypothetical protein [Candidatus Limnocylindrales bacterium]